MDLKLNLNVKVKDPLIDPVSIQEENGIELKKSFASLPVNSKERFFSPAKFLCVALVVASLAGAILPVCFPAGLVLLGIASWSLWSAAIIVINRVMDGTCLEKPVHHLHAMAMEVNAAVVATAVFPFTFFDPYHGPHGKSDGQPILMINGYLSFGSTWYYQRQRLVEAGFGPIYTMNVGSGRSIKTYAEQVRKKIVQIQKATGRKDLILIGHSKGGLVSSYYATHYKDVTDVVTIGSPLAGTRMAYLGIGHDAYEMRHKSIFHQTLRKKIQEHPQIRFFHIASEADEVVPLSSALLGENQSQQLILKDMGHLGLVFSSRVADQVCSWLKNCKRA